MPIFAILIIGIIVMSIVSAKQKELKEAQRKQAEAQARARQAGQTTVRTAPAAPSSPMESAAERARKQAELKRQLIENQARRLSEAANRPAQSATERRPLEKRDMTTSLKKEKPIVRHEDEDCSGGSIHDGYHEGVTQFEGRPTPAVAGKLGSRLADEDDRIAREAQAAENAKRVLTKISKLPPLTQGMIYSEILGKPKSEIA